MAFQESGPGSLVVAGVKRELRWGEGRKRAKGKKEREQLSSVPNSPALYSPSLPVSTHFHAGYSSVEFCSVPYNSFNSPLPRPTFIVTIFVDSRREI